MTAEIDDAVAGVWRCLSNALKAMNEAVGMTAEQGPAVAIESIADYLSNTDGIDEDLALSAPPDWLTRWRVERGEWWIATDELDRGGQKVLGPFGNQGLAFAVRSLLEKCPMADRPQGLARRQETFWIVGGDPAASDPC